MFAYFFISLRVSENTKFKVKKENSSKKNNNNKKEEKTTRALVYF